jgi:GNAT superfamily N-acetyltransferase
VEPIEIRPATPADADAVAAYHRACFLDTYETQVAAGELEPPDLGSTRDQLADWFAPDSDCETHVAVVAGSPIGHVTVSGNRLVHLFVDPAHHGTGLGGRLLALGESQIVAAGHHDLELHTRIDNHPAIAFYEHSGWTVTDVVIHTVEHGISYDELVLVKHRR